MFPAQFLSIGRFFFPLHFSDLTYQPFLFHQEILEPENVVILYFSHSRKKRC